MLLKVYYSDNDYRCCYLDACQAMLTELRNGYDDSEYIKKRFMDSINRYSIENIRKSLILAAIGFNIAECGYRGVMLGDVELNITKYEYLIDYLDKLTKISIITQDEFVQEWENSEVCYIDFNNLIVFVQ